MKNFRTYLEEGKEAELIGLLKSFGAGEIEVAGDYMSTMLRKKQMVFDIVDRLPPDVDYDVFVYSIDNNTAMRDVENPAGTDESGSDEDDYDEDKSYRVDEIGHEDLTDQFHDYELVIYLYNAEVEVMESSEEDSEEDDEDGAQVAMEEVEELEERKRIVKVNAQGKRRIKIKCKKGYKYAGNKCVKITGAEMTKKRRAIKKSVRTKKAKGSGYQRKVQRLRGRAMKRRKSMGLNSSYEPAQNNDALQEARMSKKQAKAAWMREYEQNLSNRKDHKAGKVDWDTALHMYFTGKDAKTAAETVKNPYKG